MIVDDSGCYYVTSDPFIINVFRNPQNCAMNVIFFGLSFALLKSG